MEERGGVTVLGVFTLLPDRRATWLEAWQEIARLAIRTPGCHEFRLIQGRDTIHAAVLSRWDSASTFYRFAREVDLTRMDSALAYAELPSEFMLLQGALDDVDQRLQNADGAMTLRLISAHDIVSSLPEGICTVDLEGRITLMNPAAQEMLGWTEAEVLGEDLRTILHLRGPVVPPAPASGRVRLRLVGSEGDDPLSAVPQPGETFRTEDDGFTRKDGTSFPVAYTWSPLVSNGSVVGATISFQDITERKQAEDELKHQALHDALTDLPNRTLFRDRLEQAMHVARRHDNAIALLLMDLRRFKEVNDTFGHRYGDLLLQRLAQGLYGALRESDTIARLGGDEFAVILPDADEQGGMRTARKLLEVVRRPYAIEGKTLQIDASIGIALFPEHGTDKSTLLHRADVAMYVAKHAKTDIAVYRFARFKQSGGPEAETSSLIGELQQAIERKELFLHYQPKVDVKTRQFNSVEALVRWQHPQRGFVPPDDFLPVAEHTGLIRPLTIQVLNEALRQCRLWHEEGADIRVAVNLSPEDLDDPKMADTIAALLGTRRVEPSWLEVEVSERAIARQPDRAADVLTRLHDLGVRISVDDVGAAQKGGGHLPQSGGYLSLEQLEQLPIDEIKIDQALILDMAADPEDAVNVREVIALGHDLGLEVVAEGVENQETLSQIAGTSCDLVQGFYLSHPLPAAELTRWFKNPASHPPKIT